MTKHTIPPPIDLVNVEKAIKILGINQKLIFYQGQFANLEETLEISQKNIQSIPSMLENLLGKIQLLEELLNEKGDVTE